MRNIIVFLFAAALAVHVFAQTPSRNLERRWVYLSTNFLVDGNVQTSIALLQRAAKDGYNGVFVSDFKFSVLDRQLPKYAVNARKVRDEAHRLAMDWVVAVFPIGYSAGILAQDPNLAEGLPVKDTPFLVKNGHLLPDDSLPLLNGGFEDATGDAPSKWNLADQPGRITFHDTTEKCEGTASLRMQDIGKYDPAHGHGRVAQRLKVRPFSYYHVSAKVKTENFETPENVRIQVLAVPSGASLSFSNIAIAKTQGWKQVDITFNSLEFTDVNLYLGVWNGKGGRLWWDSVRIEPAGLLNVVRRAGAPLSVTSDDGKTAYDEGRDFDGARDPRLGNDPSPGNATVWHTPPTIRIPQGTSLREGQRVRVSYYEMPLIYDGQAMCCLCEPNVYDILQRQAEQVRDLMHPDGYFMLHDEIRVQGWDQSCETTFKTPGQNLAENVRRCTEILTKADPGKPIYVWSDMFDPYHNAKHDGRYYLVKGEGPWSGSSEGLGQEVIIVNWNGDADKRVESMKFFSALGNRQILAGYYDGTPGSISTWLKDAAPISGVIGIMYTTWRNDYSQLEAFLKAAQ